MSMLFDPLPNPESNPEPSSLVGFANNKLVRDAENRNDETLPAALEDKNSQFLLFVNGKVIIHGDSDKTGRILLTQDEILDFSPNKEKAILLGVNDCGPVLAATTDIDVETLLEPFSAKDVRSLLYWTSVGTQEQAIAGQAASLLNWHKTNQFCGKCGQPTRATKAGYCLVCTRCEHMIFPRTDPAVIMLAVRDDFCLLGRSPHFPENWYSTLAGFVEPGETLEDAVRREVQEESGIAIGRVKYFASQPWPFPHSLMIGAHCEALSSDIRMDENELEDCRWFSRKELGQMIREEHPLGFKCPPNRAIASAIIMHWYEAGAKNSS